MTPPPDIGTPGLGKAPTTTEARLSPTASTAEETSSMSHPHDPHDSPPPTEATASTGGAVNGELVPFPHPRPAGDGVPGTAAAPREVQAAPATGEAGQPATALLPAERDASAGVRDT